MFGQEIKNSDDDRYLKIHLPNKKSYSFSDIFIC